MTPFRVSLVVSTGDLASLVDVLNTRTHGGYIERETRLGSGWLVCIAVDDRTDAKLLRSLSPRSK